MILDPSTALSNSTSSTSVTSEQLPQIRTMWKGDRHCSSCGTAFRITVKRRVCKFCYRGVCATCSEKRCLHPEMDAQQRCCRLCFHNFLTASFRADLTSQIAAKKDSIALIEDHLYNIRRNRAGSDAEQQSLEAEVRRKKLALAQFDGWAEKELSEQQRKLQTTVKMRGRLLQKWEETANTLNEVRAETAKMRRETAELQSALQDSEAVNSGLKTELTLLQDTHRELLYYLTAEEDLSVSVRKTEVENDVTALRNTEMHLQLTIIDEYVNMGLIGSDEIGNLELARSRLSAENALLRSHTSLPPRILIDRTMHTPVSGPAAISRQHENCCQIF